MQKWQIRWGTKSLAAPFDLFGPGHLSLSRLLLHLGRRRGQADVAARHRATPLTSAALFFPIANLRLLLLPTPLLLLALSISATTSPSLRCLLLLLLQPTAARPQPPSAAALL